MTWECTIKTVRDIQWLGDNFSKMVKKIHLGINTSISHILEIMSDPYAEAITAALNLQKLSYEPTWKKSADGPFTRAELDSKKSNDKILKQQKIINDKEAEIRKLKTIINLIRIRFSCT